MKVGFTGTRHGMRDAQWDAVQWLLRCLIARAHQAGEQLIGQHGDCIGADADFDRLCFALEIPRECRPCTYDALRANTTAEMIADPIGPMDQNHKIVESADVMLATPPTREEIVCGSGTWSTIRMTRRAGKPLHICYPDGQVEHVNTERLTMPG